MNGPALLVGVLLATSPAARQDAAPAGEPAAEPGVAREWRARAWSLAPEAHADAIAASLASDDWVERRLALDACARLGSAARASLARSPDAHRAALSHPQPNVRAAAWDVFAATGELPADVAGALAAACSDPFPGVRRAVVELCARRPEGLAPGARRALLTELAGVAGVAAGASASDARRLLLQEGVGAAAAVGALFRSDEAPLVALVDAWPDLTRAPVDADLVETMRALGSGESADAEAIAALAEALALHGERDGEHARAEARADRARLAATWTAAPAGDDPRDPFLRQRWKKALRSVAAEGDDELGRRLLARALAAAEDVGDERNAEAVEFLVEGAALALEADAALRAALEFPEELAELAGIVWLEAGPRLTAVDAAAYAPWLAAGRDEEVRFGAASALADVYARSGDRGAEALILGLLEDADSGMRRAAFRWLCDGPRLAELEPRLLAAWRSYDADERWIQLRSLPRGRVLPAFRDDLLALGASPENRRAELLELVGAQPDPETRALLSRWLEEELVGLERARGAAEYAVHEGRATALVSALAARDLDATVADALADATARALAAPPEVDFGRLEPELPKTALALLGRSAAGRARLVEFLGDDVARRARVEAAIRILRAPEPLPSAARAVAVLVADHDGCDAELGARVLVALGRAEDSRAQAFLAEVATRPRVELGRRLAAISALGRPGGEAALGEVVARFGESEAGLAAVGALARVATPAATERLREMWSATRTPVLRGELLVALAARGELAEIGYEAWLAGPAARASQDLALRFVGSARGAVEFRWEAELRAAEALAARGELGPALDATADPWRLDGELLARLSERAARGGAPAVARRLARAAHVAMAGEGLEDVRAHDRRFALTGHRLDVALGLRDFGEALDAARELAAAYRLDRPRSNAVQEGLGAFDRRRGVDPGARLEVLVEQLLAARELEAGGEDARRSAARRLGWTRARLGASAAAAGLQAELEAALRD